MMVPVCERVRALEGILVDSSAALSSSDLTLRSAELA